MGLWQFSRCSVWRIRQQLKRWLGLFGKNTTIFLVLTIDGPGLNRAGETNDTEKDSGDILDLEANTSDEDESSLFNNLFFDEEAIKEDTEDVRSKNWQLVWNADENMQ